MMDTLLGSKMRCNICENPMGDETNVIRNKPRDLTVFVCDICAKNLTKYGLLEITNEEI